MYWGGGVRWAAAGGVGLGGVYFKPLFTRDPKREPTNHLGLWLLPTQLARCSHPLASPLSSINGLGWARAQCVPDPNDPVCGLPREGCVGGSQADYLTVYHDLCVREDFFVHVHVHVLTYRASIRAAAVAAGG